MYFDFVIFFETDNVAFENDNVASDRMKYLIFSAHEYQGHA